MIEETDLQRVEAAVRAVKGIGEVSVLTRSILGKNIPLVSLGRGRRAVLYVGGMRGTDSESSGVLLQFLADYAEHYARRATVYGYPMTYLHEERKIYLLPMLNPDGVEYCLHGTDERNPLFERVMRMLGDGSLANWQANARGVDPERNFDAGFAENKARERAAGISGGAAAGYSGEFPESEPETAALCRFLRRHREEIVGVLSLHRGNGEIFCSCGDNLTAKTVSVGRVLSRMTGYGMTRPESLSPIGSLSDWCITALSRPAFTVQYEGKAENTALTYEKLRRALFSFPCIV